MTHPIEKERSDRVLTDADLQALAEFLQCGKCSFSSEEVLFVKEWLNTAKTAKSEIIKWLVKIAIIGIGLICGLQVALKMGFGKDLIK